jgi:HEPN domain-containing protein
LLAEPTGNEERAEKTYRMVLERYPTSAKLLKSYARFLEDVKHDPWAAEKYHRWVAILVGLSLMHTIVHAFRGHSLHSLLHEIHFMGLVTCAYR